MQCRVIIIYWLINYHPLIISLLIGYTMMVVIGTSEQVSEIPWREFK